MGFFKDLGDRISGRHAENMQQQQLAADQQEKDAQRAAQAVADQLHYENEEKKRNADERRENKNRESQERIAKTNADKEIEKARIAADSVAKEREQENSLKIALAQKQVEASAKEQEEQTERTRLEEEAENVRLQLKEQSNQLQIQEQTEQIRVSEEGKTKRAEIEKEARVAAINATKEMLSNYLQVVSESHKTDVQALIQGNESRKAKFLAALESARIEKKELILASKEAKGQEKLDYLNQMDEIENTIRDLQSNDKEADMDFSAKLALIRDTQKEELAQNQTKLINTQSLFLDYTGDEHQ